MDSKASDACHHENGRRTQMQVFADPEVNRFLKPSQSDWNYSNTGPKQRLCKVFPTAQTPRSGPRVWGLDHRKSNFYKALQWDLLSRIYACIKQGFGFFRRSLWKGTAVWMSGSFQRARTASQFLTWFLRASPTPLTRLVEPYTATIVSLFVFKRAMDDPGL